MIQITINNTTARIRPRWFYRWQGFFRKVILEDAHINVVHHFFGVQLKEFDASVRFTNIARQRNFFHQVFRMDSVTLDWLDDDIPNLNIKGIPIKDAELLVTVIKVMKNEDS